MIYKKRYFNFSGAAEMAIIFFSTPFLGAIRSIGDTGVAVVKDGVCWTHGGKQGARRMKDIILGSRSQQLEKKYLSWRNKWSSYEKELYYLATAKTDWKKNLAKQNDLNDQFWFESYFLETIDNYTDEIEARILQGMKNANINEKYKNILISPEVFTCQQIINKDLERVKLGKMSRARFMRKHWYYHANWNGGDFINEKILNKDLRQNSKQIDIRKIKLLHKQLEKELDNKTNNLIHLIRTIAVWREDRKAFMQMLTLGIKNAVNLAVSETGIDYQYLIWATPEELLAGKIDIALFKQRHDLSVIITHKDGKRYEIVTGKIAQAYYKEFIDSGQTKELKGTIASPGKVQGRVKIIIKKNQFANFKKNDILVTTMTRPEFLPLMRKAKAVVTDEGGLTCHAAIISRELGLPCIVGAKNATQVLEDNDIVEVDANKGLVKILN